ncbi:MAG: glycosyl hydrolase family 28-related protein, partial [Gammaproteobacteria bacterium]
MDMYMSATSCTPREIPSPRNNQSINSLSSQHFLTSRSRILRYLSLLVLLSVLAMSFSQTAFGATATAVGMFDVTDTTKFSGVYKDSTTQQDSTVGINNAIKFARDNNKALYFPSGTYYVSDTILGEDNPQQRRGTHDGTGTIQLIGQTTGTRPVISLKDNSPLFAGVPTEKNNKRVVEIRHTWFDPVTKTVKEAADSAFRDIFRGIDINVGSGNPLAVGLKFDAAQHSMLEDVKITGTGSYYAGITAVPGANMAATNIEVVGGKHGLRLSGADLGGSSLGALLVGLKLSGQTGPALHLDIGSAPVVIGLEITKNSGTSSAIELGNNYFSSGNMTLIDAKIDMLGTDPAIDNVPIYGSPGRFVALTNVYVRHAATTTTPPPYIVDTTDPALGKPDGDLPGVTNGGWTWVKEFTFTPTVIGSEIINGTRVNFNATNLIDGVLGNTSIKTITSVASAPTDLISRNVWSSTPSFDTAGVVLATAAPYNAIANDIIDDTAAIQAALDSSLNAKVYLPAGTYIIKAPLLVGANDTLMGVPGFRSTLQRSTGWIQPYDSVTGDGRTWMIDTEPSASGTALLQDLALDNDHASVDKTVVGGIRWRVGRNSMVRGVRTTLAASRNEGTPAQIFRIEGNGGGRWYSLADHVGVNNSSSNPFVDPLFRKLYVTGTSQPLTFYGLNLEHGGVQSPTLQQYAFSEMVNASNVRILGSKIESDGLVYIFDNCPNLFAAMLFANENSNPKTPLVEMRNTLNAQNAPKAPALFYGVSWPSSSSDELVKDDDPAAPVTRSGYHLLGVYKLGVVDHTVWQNPNIAPTVSITSPANGASLPLAATTISATANDSDGTVVRVDFKANGTLINSDTTSPFSVSWTPAAGSYSLTADATDNVGATTKSAAVDVTVVAPPAAPAGLTPTAGNAQVALSWTASSGAASYTVKRATVTGGPYTTVVSGITTTSYTDTGLTNGTTYFYVVSAVNVSGESSNSNQA